MLDQEGQGDGGGGWVDGRDARRLCDLEGCLKRRSAGAAGPTTA
jgi:hypothetical protein